MTTKQYRVQNVYEAARERVAAIFDEFEKIVVAFSGGKDSGVLLNLAIDEARRRPGRRVAAMILDLEGQYKLTMEYVTRMFDANADVVEPYWLCLPINLRNAVSVYQPFWCPWEPGKEDAWIRPMPAHPAVISDPGRFPFWKERMEFEEFAPAFSKWHADGTPTACLVGIRSDESLNRWRTIASTSKEQYNGLAWTTRLNGSEVYNAYPIYDWRTEDVWIANGRIGWDYNHLYDLFHKAGVGIHQMRICQPFGDDQRIGLDLFRIIEPETWARVVNRVSGANFGNIYAGNKILGYRNVKLPPGHTWKSYTQLLLASLPPEARENYEERFRKFAEYWADKGSPIRDELIALLPPGAEVLDTLSTRGKKDKRVVRYREVPDTLPPEIESHKAAPTWRRMAVCILKNDHLCKGLSFGQTKRQAERTKHLMEKYRNL